VFAAASAKEYAHAQFCHAILVCGAAGLASIAGWVLESATTGFAGSGEHNHEGIRRTAAAF
jgi:hypothetical protein